MTGLKLRASAFLVILAAVLTVQQTAYGQVTLGDGTVTTQTIEEVLLNAPPIMRVEEDWEMIIADPDPAANIPQICTVFGPTDPTFDTHVVFELNHGTLPSFSEGGMQLQVWWTDYMIGYLSQLAPTELDTYDEKITYTTVTRLHDSKLRMFIINGDSQTWGQFGGSQSLWIWLWSNRTDLNPYDPMASIRNSRVTFGANRVNRFCRREIRFYDENAQLFAKDSTTRFVHQLAIDTP